MNHWTGRHHSEESKEKISRSISLLQEGRLRGPYKGRVGYEGVHWRIRRFLPKPELCDLCHLKPAYDLTNISGKYLDSLDDWQYLCRSCHVKSDGRIYNLRHQKKFVSNV